jgi:hypothetical protein
MIARSPEIVATVTAAPRRRASASISAVPRSASSNASAATSADSASMAQLSPRWGSNGSPAASARRARSFELAGELHCTTNAERVFSAVRWWQTPAASPLTDRRSR